MRRFEFGALALGVAAAALVLYATAPHGPALFQLGMHNAVAAESLLRGETMATTRGEVFAQWPPLLPWLLALGRKLGATYEFTARVLNAASFGAIVFLVMTWTRKLFGVAWVAALAGLTLAVQPTLFEAATVLSSEPLYIVCALAALLAAHAHYETPTRASLVTAIVFSAAACLQRYVGVVVIGAVAALGWLYWPRDRRWKDLASYVVASAAPLAAWMARNVVVAGALTGERPPADFEVQTHLSDASRILTTWWVGEGEAEWALRLSATLFLGLGVLSTTLLLRRGRLRTASVWFAAFPLAYAAFLIVVASTIWLDPLDVRLLSPLLVFGCALAPLGAWVVLDAANSFAPRAKLPAALALGAAALVILAYDARRTLQAVAKDRADGPGGFGSAATQRSELIGWLRTHPLEGPIYSNAPEYYAYATWRPAQLAPAKRTGEFLAELPPDQLPLTLVWPSPAGAATLRSVRNREDLDVQTLAELADGVVLRIAKR